MPKDEHPDVVVYRGAQIKLRATKVQAAWRIFFPAHTFPSLATNQREFLRQFGTAQHAGTSEKKAAAWEAALDCAEEKLSAMADAAMVAAADKGKAAAPGGGA